VVRNHHFLLIATAFWAVFGLVAGLLVWISMHDHGHDGVRLLGYFIIVWLGWLAPTWFIGWLVRRLPFEARPRVIAVHLLSATAIAALHPLYEAALLLTIRPYDVRNATWDGLDLGAYVYSRLPLGWILYCLILGAVLAFEYYQRYHERALRAAQLERSLADAKLHALELQLQPHFLFNTLNSVAGLVRSRRNDEAVTVIAGLADLLRYSLDHAGRQRVPLGEEIEMLRRHLEIEAVRFSDRLSYRIEVGAEARQALVPNLILQPLVENALRHGIATLASAGTIDVSAEREGERLRIRVRNSGTLAADPVEGIGITNTRARLHNLYGDGARFSLAATEAGVQAVLDLPWEAAR
jgi:signal transduction histidine kinase